MQVLNSYLQLHNAVIMLTALPNHKIHTHTKHTDKKAYSTIHHMQAYSLALSLSISVSHVSQTKALSEITPYLPTVFTPYHFSLLAFVRYSGLKCLRIHKNSSLRGTQCIMMLYGCRKTCSPLKK